MKCPKCNGEMEKGIIADRTTDWNIKMQPQWGTTIDTMGLGLQNSHNVATYRCNNCGYLENYAK